MTQNAQNVEMQHLKGVQSVRMSGIALENVSLKDGSNIKNFAQF